jgi:hypothetical protein
MRFLLSAALLLVSSEVFAGNVTNIKLKDGVPVYTTTAGAEEEIQVHGVMGVTAEAGCDWPVSSTTYVAPAVDAACASPLTVLVEKGCKIDTTNTQLPEINFTELPRGTCRVTAMVQTYGTSNSAYFALDNGSGGLSSSFRRKNTADGYEPVRLSHIYFHPGGVAKFRLMAKSASGTVYFHLSGAINGSIGLLWTVERL